MSEVSKMSNQVNCGDTSNVISSQVSELGPSLSDKQDGRITDLYGLAPALANLSATQARDAGLLTSGTYGLHSSISLMSADLTRSLANRLRLRTDLLGSTLFKLTWKERITPLGRLIPALRASVLRTSGNDCTSWVSPTAQDHSRGNKPARLWDTGIPLTQQVALVGWPTPNGDDANNATRDSGSFQSLTRQVRLTSWVSPASRDWKDTAGMKTEAENPDGTKRNHVDQLPRQAQLTVSGKIPIGSPAATESSGQLNPAFSCWLMGLPTELDDCAAMVTRFAHRKRKPS
jgi:hypothetical protein